MVAARLKFLIAAWCMVCFSALAHAAQWGALDAEEQRALAPLAELWDGLTEVDRQTWQAMVRGFRQMLPDEQARMQARMREWAQLSPADRERARDQYKALRNMPPDQREALKLQWQQYRKQSVE